MSISLLYITDRTGKPIISRNYRGDMQLEFAITKFQRYLRSIETETPADELETNDDDSVQKKPVPAPCVAIDNLHYIYVQHNNILLLAVTHYNINTMMILEFLYSLIDIMIDYFGELNDETIRDHFVLCYELLDEVFDFGYPQYTDSSILKEFILVKRLSAYTSTKRRNRVQNNIPVVSAYAVDIHRSFTSCWQPNNGLRHAASSHTTHQYARTARGRATSCDIYRRSNLVSQEQHQRDTSACHHARSDDHARISTRASIGVSPHAPC